MHIPRTRFDQQPLLIRQGALQLWGTLLARRVDLCRVRELYWFSDFFAELCYNKQTGQATCVCTFTRSQRLAIYLEEMPVPSIL
jgi:hypothetical protein